MSAFVQPTAPEAPKRSQATNSAGGTSLGRIGILIAIVAGFIIIYSVIISPAIRGTPSDTAVSTTTGLKRPKIPNSLKNTKKKKKVDEDDEEEDDRRILTMAPSNRLGDGVPPGRGHHFDELHIQKIKDMVDYARANHLPDPFPGVPPDEVENHIRDHKAEVIDAPKAKDDKRPIRKEEEENKDGAKGTVDPDGVQTDTHNPNEQKKHDENPGLVGHVEGNAH